MRAFEFLTEAVLTEAVGREFNQNYATISEASQSILDASTGQYFRMYSVFDGVERHEKDGLSERENFFHKPRSFCPFQGCKIHQGSGLYQMITSEWVF